MYSAWRKRVNRRSEEDDRSFAMRCRYRDLPDQEPCTRGISDARTRRGGFQLIDLGPDISQKTFNLEKLQNHLSFPLTIFGRSDTKDTIRLFKRLVKTLIHDLVHQDWYQGVRSLIDDLFKVAKDAFALRKFHRYITRSLTKAV